MWYRNFMSIASLLLCLALGGCPDPGCLDTDPKYAFNITGAFTPDNDSVALGDTVYFVSAFPSTLTPVGTQDPVDYTNASKIGNVITVIEYLPNYQRRWAAYDFDYIALKGEAFNSKEVPTPEGAEQIRYEEIGNKYEMNIAIVPKKKGNYIFLIGGAYSDSRKIKGKDRCDRASFNLTISNDQRRNYALTENWAGGSIGNPGGGYAFTVY